MDERRRHLLKAAGLAVTAGLAGCSGSKTTEPTDTTTGTPTTSGGEGSASASVSAKTAVAAEWNVYRGRLFDAVALGTAGQFSAGASVAAAVYERFEKAGGEWGAHERLEKASTEAYESFEGGLERLETGLNEENSTKALSAAVEAAGALRSAMTATVAEETVLALDLQYLGGRAANAGSLAAAGYTDAAATVADRVLSEFEKAPSHEAVEEANHEAYEAFESGLKTAKQAASNGDGKTAQSQSQSALSAAIDGSYSIAAKKAAGAGELATMQGRGWDARALARLGGPGTDAAHAGALNVYRLRAYDCHWLAARGETDRAATMAGDILAHFENAKAHEAFEHADHDAYEAFEQGVKDLQTAISNGNSAGVDKALKQIDTNLVTGISTLADSDVAAALEAGFNRARLADAWEQYELGQNNTAASIVGDLYERFEADELGFHALFEKVDHDLYETFEHHLEDLEAAFTNTNDSAAKKHYTGAKQAALTFETKATSTAVVSVSEAGYLDARAFDAAAQAALGNLVRAETIVTGAVEHFEAGAGGFHEALEHADHDLYETFEADLAAVATAAANNADVYAKTTAFNATALTAAYAVVAAAGSPEVLQTAAGVVGGIYERFEKATAHELLEKADHETYEEFEHALEAYQKALSAGSNVDARATAFAEVSVRAQFAVVGALGKAPGGN